MPMLAERFARDSPLEGTGFEPSVPPVRLLRTLEDIRPGPIGAAIDHQHRDQPDLDLPYHAGNGGMFVFRIA